MVKEFKNEVKSDLNKLNENKNGENEKRPKRFAAQVAQTFFLQEQTSVIFYKEQRDLKKAMKASLIEARKAKYNRNEIEDNLNQLNNETALRKSNGSIIHYNNFEYSNNHDRENSSQSVNNKKTKIPAQRKFAQGSSSNTPNSSPIKVKSKSISNVSEVFTKHRPSTEDFLTFLCFRNTQFLPPHLDFYSLNKKLDNSLCSSNLDELQNQKEVSKENSFKSYSNNSKKIINLINDVKVNKVKNFHYKAKFVSQEIFEKNYEDHENKKLKKVKEFVKDKITSKIETFKNDKNNLKPPLQFTKVTTRSSSLKKNTNVNQAKSNSKPNILSHDSSQTNLNTNSQNFKEISVRVLRSKKSITLPDTKSDNQLLVKSLKPNKTIDKRYKRSHNSIGIRPHKRKAKPSALIDLHYILDEEESEECEEKVVNKNYQKKEYQKEKKFSEINNSIVNLNKSSKLNLNLTNKKKYQVNEVENKKEKINKLLEQKEKMEKEKNLTKQTQNKKVTDEELPAKKFRKEKLIKKEEKAKVLNKNKSEKKFKKAFLIDKRVTRRGANSNLSNMIVPETRESFIKQKIIAIEQRHKSWQNFFSESSIHSCTESTTSSESFPSSSSSTSVNLPRLTRSLEVIKQLRAKVKLENQKQEKCFKLNPEPVKKLQKNSKIFNNKCLETSKQSLRDAKKAKQKEKKLKSCPTQKKEKSLKTVKNEINLRSKSKKFNHMDSKINQKMNKLQGYSKIIQLKSALNQDKEKAKLIKNKALNKKKQNKTKCNLSSALNNCSNNLRLNDSEITGQVKPTVDASTFATEEDILACTGADFTDDDYLDHQLVINEFSVATQTVGPADPLMVAMFGKLGFE